MRRFLPLMIVPALAVAEVRFTGKPGRVEILIDGKPFSNLYHGGTWAKPFLHPLRSVSGTVVTRGYPVEQAPGEAADHVWHHGLWYAHGDVNGVDFWRDKGPETTGRMTPRAKPVTKGDSIMVAAEMVAPDKRVLGTVEETFRFERDGSNQVVDARIVIRADRGVPLKMGDTEEGAFGLRLADEFREERGVAMNNSEGHSGRKVWGKRARWVDYSSTVKGEKLGVIMMDHPGNPKHPTYWHARHYSLCSANPFGEHDFEKDKSRDGSVSIAAGGKLEFRYRVVIHPGGLDAIDPEALFGAFARSR